MMMIVDNDDDDNEGHQQNITALTLITPMLDNKFLSEVLVPAYVRVFQTSNHRAVVLPHTTNNVGSRVSNSMLTCLC
jgi:hypothetical protein